MSELRVSSATMFDELLSIRDGALLVIGGAPRSRLDLLSAARDGAAGCEDSQPILGRATEECVVALLAAWLRDEIALVVDPREPAARVAELSARLRRAGLRGPGVALSTSGSAGRPKLVVHGLESLLANAEASNRRVPFGPADRWLLSLGLHHVGGLGILMRAIAGGGTVVVGGGPGAVVADLAATACTHASVVATQLRRLLDEPAFAKRPPASRAILVGGGPTPASWRREAIRRGWPIQATYGLTECASQVATGRAALDDDATASGTPLDGVEVAIEEGEILVRGPIVARGAIDDAGVLRDLRRADGFLSTGDLGRIDARGVLHVLGRSDGMFISGGENILPEEIENALREVPGIRAARVVAVDDERWQRRPIAFVDGAFDPRELVATLERLLPRFKWPDRIHAMPAEEAARTKPRAEGLLASVGEPLWRR